ncbi:MAG: cytochrome c3 family protein [Elusimicrobia bacterium]|nr:cytochrome c3 family protein [Elusimicrobiota bacterium]
MSREWLLAAAGWAAVVLGLGGLSLWAYGTWEAAQPLAFDHKRHVAWGIACNGCHVGAKDAAEATLPGVSVCALCHQPGRAAPPTPDALAEPIEEGREIQWKRIYKAPAHVRFSHKRHAGLGGVECRSCHGDVGSLERPVGRQAVALRMERCMDCHRREKVTTDCMACHR